MNPKVDAFMGRAKNWPKEMEKLRTVCLSCGLEEELKWGKPCYTFHGKNIVVIQGFKEYCALLFLKGYLLGDPDKILVKTGENTVVSRQARFLSVKDITKVERALKACIYEAIEVEKSGVKGEALKKEAATLTLPEEFKEILAGNAALRKAYNALTPSRQKVYNMYFSQPKQSKTRTARVEKYMKHILNGKGMYD